MFRPSTRKISWSFTSVPLIRLHERRLDDLESVRRIKLVADKQRLDKAASQGSRRRWFVKEMQENIETQKYEHEPQQNSRIRKNNFRKNGHKGAFHNLVDCVLWSFLF